MFHHKKAKPPERAALLNKAADPRLLLAYDIANQLREIQLATIVKLKDRSLALLEIIFLGASVVFGIGASSHGDLRLWMVILLLIALGYTLLTTLWIILPGTWHAVSDWDVLLKATTSPPHGQECRCTECATKSRTLDECLGQFLAEGKEASQANECITKYKRYLFVSQFVVLGTLIVLAVIFWGTLGS